MQGNRVQFDDVQVEITLPTQARQVKVKRLATDDSLKNRVTPGFKPHRIVINFQVEEELDPAVVVTDFDPPFELRVRYTPADVREAGGLTSLALAFWDGETWVKFTPEKHSFQLVPDSKGEGGAGVVIIKKWGDPNIGWGT